MMQINYIKFQKNTKILYAINRHNFFTNKYHRTAGPSSNLINLLVNPPIDTITKQKMK